MVENLGAAQKPYAGMRGGVVSVGFGAIGGPTAMIEGFMLS